MTNELIDPFGRSIRYLRLSVTDRCDLRCQYCIPKGFKKFEHRESWLTFEEIERIIRAFSELGVHRVRMTGGEPLLRKGLPELAAGLAALPDLDDLSLSTNATQLEKHAAALKQAGVHRINVSLDSLNADVFSSITQGGKLDKVLAGLQAARNCDLAPIKINMVVMRGINDHEVDSMLQYCMENEFTLRFIETMPIGDTGRNAGRHFVSLDTIRIRLTKQFDMVPSTMPGGGPARYMQVGGTDMKIGFITPMSQHFCKSCNRVRLSVDGRLHLCLGQNDNVSLREPLRQGISDKDLKELLLEAIAKKPERHEFRKNPLKINRVMSLTGG
ncbi:MAG: GTP 3',8-cyclase MoaA [Gammaproteobacteria bacterium]|nr:MAG: GTP 3',8-cyclase MoaA [Gammaproteobacteria bacterium]